MLFDSKRGIGLGILAAIILMGVFLLRSLANPLRTLLSADSCSAACWQGIQPGVTDAAQVEAVLDRLGLAFEVIRVSDEPEVVYRFPFPTSFNPSNFDGDIWVDDTVWRLILPVQACFSTVTAAYGPPDFVSQGAEVISLIYPSQGLTFTAPNKPGVSRITTVEIGTEADTRQVVSDLENLRSDWASLQAVIADDCADPPGQE